MPDIHEIHALDDPQIQVYSRLTEAQLRSRIEETQGLFIAESPNVISTALDAGYEAVSLLMDRRHIEGKAAPLIARIPDVPIFTADAEVLRALTGYPLTRGVLAAMRRKPLPRMEDICQSARRIAVLENIVDTTNVGAIFRSAAALGVDAVLMTPSACDPFNRRVVRVSMGTVFQVPWTYTSTESADWPEAGLEALQSMGFRTAAMALRADAKPLGDTDLSSIPRLAIVLGTEGDGLKSETIASCDMAIRIPMSHGVDSLNVSAAAAIAFWEARRR